MFGILIKSRQKVTMTQIDVNKIRENMMLTMPPADIDAEYNFFYDETNNIKKFHIKNGDFNHSFDINFVLGGLLYEGEQPEVDTLFSGLKLQKTTKEIKLNHIAKGDFLDCLKSQKLQYFLKFLLVSKFMVHYSTINVLYYSIVDIVDSAVANTDGEGIGFDLLWLMKNDLYKLCKLEQEAVAALFYKYQYPNIKADGILDFIYELTSLFVDYEDTEEFHLGLVSLKQILKESKRKKTLPFVMDEQDHVLLKEFYHFYLRPLYVFKNSKHVFDNEDEIKETFDKYELLDDGEIAVKRGQVLIC